VKTWRRSLDVGGMAEFRFAAGKSEFISLILKAKA
jgi:hypothetical protein